LGTGLVKNQLTIRGENTDYSPERFKIVVHYNPEHRKAVQAQTNTGVVDDADIKVA